MCNPCVNSVVCAICLQPCPGHWVCYEGGNACTTHNTGHGCLRIHRPQGAFTNAPTIANEYKDRVRGMVCTATREQLRLACTPGTAHRRDLLFSGLQPGPGKAKARQVGAEFQQIPSPPPNVVKFRTTKRGQNEAAITHGQKDNAQAPTYE